MDQSSAYWVVIPAAGVGRRMGAARPKQYLELAGRAVIDHVVRLFADNPRIAGVFVALDPNDAYWPSTGLDEHPRVWRVDGGAERCHSVGNAIAALSETASDTDWVLVHDAARPCVRWADIEHLIDTLSDHAVGGLLGVPVCDTIKQAGEASAVARTVPRADLWHAYTPQMFRLGLLREALERALAAGEHVTDDASAVELMGLQPLLVEGHADNLKITRPEDLALAAFYLQQQGR